MTTLANALDMLRAPNQAQRTGTEILLKKHPIGYGRNATFVPNPPNALPQFRFQWTFRTGRAARQRNYPLFRRLFEWVGNGDGHS